ncbi:hypothetical protein [Flavobacterium soli]|uniref:hypothetical protein n=1 Tax=Flavobacterium soli TaxID=344881 RepID=UPI00047BC6D3|nr:hypothetical protein [Flavobacterium soli]
MKWYFFVFIVSLSAYSQPLSLKIDSISVDDQDPVERIFKVYYHLENLTDQPLLFLHDTSGIVPSTGGSGTYFPFYKIYENNTFLEIGSVFSGWDSKRINFEELNIDSLKVRYQKKLDTDQNKEKLISDKIIEIAPKGIKKFTIDFYWDRNRYYQNQDIEYYLEEEADHFIEITMVMQKPNLETESQDVDYEKFIQGVFTSNKQLIDFGKEKED